MTKRDSIQTLVPCINSGVLWFSGVEPGTSDQIHMHGTTGAILAQWQLLKQSLVRVVLVVSEMAPTLQM